MTVDDVLTELEALGDEKRRAFNAKRGATDNQFGVKTGDVRKLAKKLKANHELGRELWATGNADARMLAILIMKPGKLSPEELDEMVRSVNAEWVADWFNSYIVKKRKDTQALRERWMAADHPMAARAGWNLTSIFVSKRPESLDFPALLDRLEAEMGEADRLPQWTMNFTLAEIGIHHPEHRERALAIGEKLGVFRDYRAPKGCTSPFAPIWINEMVSRQS